LLQFYRADLFVERFCLIEVVDPVLISAFEIVDQEIGQANKVISPGQSQTFESIDTGVQEVPLEFFVVFYLYMLIKIAQVGFGETKVNEYNSGAL
jgi:hypothetical protein